MKKVFLGVLLLALLVAVSYVKIHRDSAQRDQARQQGVAQGQADLAARSKQIDSLAAVMAEREREMAESLVSRDLRQAQQTDSLEAVLDSQCERIETLQKQAQKPRSQPKKKTPTSAAKAPDSGADSSAGKAAHKDILAYYTEQVDKLPKDLSDYERRVAVKEVREETAKKFSITTQRLDEIRKQYSLDY